MKTISIPTNDRLELLMECLNSIRNAVGYKQWTIVFNCEPKQRVVDYVSRISWAPIYFHRNPCQMGCWVNTFLAANFAMSLGSDFNLYLEDDIVISRDALTLADQFRKSRYQVLSLRRPEPYLSNFPQRVSSFPGGLLGDGFAWRKEDWPTIRSLWFQRSSNGKYEMWDWSIEHGMKERNITQARPCLNRSQNIGLMSVGTHKQSYDPHHHSACYSGEPITQFHFDDPSPS